MEIIVSSDFEKWLRKLRDKTAKALISKRISRMANGNMGDIKSVGSGILEARIHYGPGYRVYFMMVREELIVLLCGGDKSDQIRDIASARILAEEWKND